MHLIIQDSELGDDRSEPEAKKAKEEPSLPKLLDGKYFEVIERNGNNVHTLCKICGIKRRGTVRSTGNFMDHIKKRHPTLIAEIEAYKKSKKNEFIAIQQKSLFSTVSMTAKEVSQFSSLYSHSSELYYHYVSIYPGCTNLGKLRD